MKRTLKIVLLVFCFLITFRGQLFRACVTYVPLEQIKLQNRASDFRSATKESPKDPLASTIEQQIIQALRYTSSQLYFTTESSSSDPIQLLQTRDANCIGYGNFFLHQLECQLEIVGIADDYELQQWRGKLYFLGWDIHNLFKDSFWKDHDFNIIVDPVNGKKMAVDATLYDYFRIHTVRLQ